MLDLRNVYKRSFKLFCDNVINQPIGDSHIKVIDFIQDNIRKKTNKANIAIEAHRGWYKTWVFSRAFPLYLIYSHDKPIHIIIQSMNQTIARYILGLSRDVINSNEYFSNFTFKKETAELLEIYIPGHEGDDEYTHKIYSIPVGARGYHGDIVITDDIQKDEDGRTITSIKKLKSTWWQSTFPMANARDGFHILNGTPISNDDLFYDVEEKVNEGAKWKIFRRPIVYEEDGVWKSNFPEKYPLEKVWQMKANMPTWAWQQEYMLQPSGGDSNIFSIEVLENASNLEYVALSEDEIKRKICYIGCDIAMSKATGADYSVFFIISKAPGRPLKVEHCYKGKGVDEDVQIDEIKRLKRIYNYTDGYIERKGLSYAMGKKVVTDPELADRIQEWNPTNEEKSKIIGNLQLVFRHKMLYIPKDTEHYDDLISELLSFVTVVKNGTMTYRAMSGHDDMVIALALALAAAGGWVYDHKESNRLVVI